MEVGRYLTTSGEAGEAESIGFDVLPISRDGIDHVQQEVIVSYRPVYDSLVVVHPIWKLPISSY